MLRRSVIGCRTELRKHKKLSRDMNCSRGDEAMTLSGELRSQKSYKFIHTSRDDHGPISIFEYSYHNHYLHEPVAV